MFFSYIGTHYSGLQRQNTGNVVTIAGTIDRALQCLSPANVARTYPSSRTDKGVHAFRNSLHVDLLHPNEGKEFHPVVITNLVNRYMMKHGEDIRVLETLRVNDRFNRHKARGRKYVYRIAHSSDPRDHAQHPDYVPWISRHGTQSQHIQKQLRWHGSYLRKKKELDTTLPLGDFSTMLDSQKAKIFLDHLDINRLIQAAQKLTGIHNYTGFSKLKKDKNSKQDPNGGQPHPLKLLTIGVKRGQPFGYRLQKGCQPMFGGLEFWDIHVQSRSFLYRMVRKLVAAMVLHARGKISLADIEDVLDNPRRDFWYSGQLDMAETGLFLREVEYLSEDLKYDETDMSSVQKSRIYHPHNDLLYILNKRKEMLLTENFSTNNQTDLKQGNHHQQIVSEVLR